MKTELTIEQSRELIKLGIDSSKASLVGEFKGSGDLKSFFDEYLTDRDESYRKYTIFTLDDLLDFIPKSFRRSISYKIDGEECTFYTDYHLIIKYENNNWIVTIDCVNNLSFPRYFEEELIDALYKLVIWCIENGYIKTETK